MVIKLDGVSSFFDDFSRRLQEKIDMSYALIKQLEMEVYLAKEKPSNEYTNSEIRDRRARLEVAMEYHKQLQELEDYARSFVTIFL